MGIDDATGEPASTATQQQQQIDELRAEVATLRELLSSMMAPAAPSAATDHTPGGPDVSDTSSTTLGRRALLRRAGAATVTATGGVLLAGAAARPATAATGDNFVLGSSNSANAVTILTSTAASANTRFVVRDDATISTTAGGYGVIKALGTQGLSAALVGHTTGALGAGIVGSATATGGVGAVFAGPDDGTDARLNPGGPVPTTRLTYRHQAGDLTNDANGDLWVCVADSPTTGTPGTWRKLGGPGTAGSFHPLAAPARVFDSRLPGAGGIFTDKTQRVLDATQKTNGSPSGVPAGATAIAVNLAVTATNAGGFAALWPSGAYPGHASVNWSLPGFTTSNGTTTALTAAGTFTCRVEGSAHVIVDVLGYYR